MTALAKSSFETFLKTQYPFGPEVAFYESCKFAGMVKKSDRFVGEAVVVPVKYSTGHKASAGFSDLQSNFNAGRKTKFVYTETARNYGIVQLETELIRRSQGNPAALVSAVKDETDNVLEAISMQLASALYGNGGGAIGRIASGGSGTTSFVLTDLDDVKNFYVGMRIYPDTTDGTSGSPQTDQVIEVTRVDRETGTITAGANFGNVFVAGNYVFIEGNFGEVNKVADGLAAHIPAAAPTSGDSFHGVDRSVDPTRLAGMRMDADATLDASIHRALLRGASLLRRQGDGVGPDTIMLGSSAYAQLLQEVEDKTVNHRSAVGMNGGKTSVGYEGISLTQGSTKLTVFEDIWCPNDTAWMLKMDTWEVICVPGGWPGVLDDDGKDKQRVYNADAVEWRWGTYWDLLCKAPGRNMRIDLTDVLSE